MVYINRNLKIQGENYNNWARQINLEEEAIQAVDVLIIFVKKWIFMEYKNKL
jgi:hypothetical protein